MSFLDFYTVDLTIIIIIILSTGVLMAGFNYVDKMDEWSTTSKFCISSFIGIVISVIYSFLTLENDNLLKENFWE